MLFDVLILGYLFYPMFIIGLLERNDRTSVINKLALLLPYFIIHLVQLKTFSYTNHS